MALSQEFWLQRRRREAAGTGAGQPATAGVPTAPRPAATVYQSGPRAPMATTMPPAGGAACQGALRPPAQAAMSSASAWPPMAGPGGGGPPSGAMGYSAQGAGNSYGSSTWSPGPQSMYMNSQAGAGGHFPMQGPPSLRPAVQQPGGSLVGMPGMAALLGTRRFIPSVAANSEHKEWNSDDEEIDEFGRKKVTNKSSVSSTARPASGKAEKKGTPDKDEAAETSKKGKASRLSAKQQAALERLHRRSQKPPAPEPADTTPAAAAAASAETPKDVGLAGLQMLQGAEAAGFQPAAAAAADGTFEAATAQAIFQAAFAAGCAFPFVPGAVGLAGGGEFPPAAAAGEAAPGADGVMQVSEASDAAMMQPDAVENAASMTALAAQGAAEMAQWLMAGYAAESAGAQQPGMQAPSTTEADVSTGAAAGESEAALNETEEA
eukprot:CAMPEP_0178416366 /NCGR_PEP_ID=MMETSP0689_2-20121128/24027_1 /TAXON_ID=160604 /ORGANISM="Amphidinium massartii, Strain CS-259" /LENGTH=434 /DNA_ID=CAMNT_0020037709 /DNA_START=51 /DNA_END=1351 /DNA_ORIENTATION=+